jgi:hypothetical protein
MEDDKPEEEKLDDRALAEDELDEDQLDKVSGGFSTGQGGGLITPGPAHHH